MGISNVILLPSLLALVWYVLVIVGGFKMFNKANKPAILAIIPVVNFFVLVDAVTDGKWYKGFWMLVPIADIVFLIKFSIKTAKCYGFSVGFGILTLFFPFVCSLIMGFSSNRFAVVD